MKRTYADLDFGVQYVARRRAFDTERNLSRDYVGFSHFWFCFSILAVSAVPSCALIVLWFTF